MTWRETSTSTSNAWEGPFTFRVGSVGAGIGVGCGVGLGFGRPLNLHGIPGVGQAPSGISSGVTSISHSLGGVFPKVQAAVHALGIKGLEAGAGCGVGIGYGYGAGLMLKPSALEAVLKTVRSTTDSVRTKLPVLLPATPVALAQECPEFPKVQQDISADTPVENAALDTGQHLHGNPPKTRRRLTERDCLHLAILTSPLPAEDKPLVIKEVDELLDAAAEAPHMGHLEVSKINDRQFQTLVLSNLARLQLDNRRTKAKLEQISRKKSPVEPSVWEIAGYMYLGFVVGQLVNWTDQRCRANRPE